MVLSSFLVQVFKRCVWIAHKDQTESIVRYLIIYHEKQIVYIAVICRSFIEAKIAVLRTVYPNIAL